LELKRKRPKTHWLWYIGTIVASLGVGLSIAYAIGQTQRGFDAKTEDKMDIAVNFTPKENYKNTPRKQPIVKTVETKINPAVPTTPVAEDEAPIYQALVKKPSQIEPYTHSNHTTQTKTSLLKTTKTKITTSKKRSEKPFSSSQPKPSNENGSNNTPPKTEKPPVNPNPVPEPTPSTEPSNQHKGPIVKVVDRVTNTVQYLLTGKTKHN
jgi:hypothetical protein